MGTNKGQICGSGLKVIRPRSRAVGSPSRLATQPCAASCTVTANIGGSAQMATRCARFKFFHARDYIAGPISSRGHSRHGESANAFCCSIRAARVESLQRPGFGKAFTGSYFNLLVLWPIFLLLVRLLNFI